jgi:dienelactone hydrolase
VIQGRLSGRIVLGGTLAVGIFVALAYHFATGKNSSDDQGAGEPGPSEHPCAEGLEPLVGDACYAAPQGASPLPLIIYLHGFFEEGPGEGQNEALDQQRRVALRATARGFAVLALRGTEGACATSPENATKVCWPSNEKVAYKGPQFVREWQPALAAAAARHPFTKRYIFGFSNGGYFAGLIAVRALYDADAFAIAHAGSVEPVKALGAKPPLLLMSADEDLSQEGMLRFDEELTREEWLHENHSRGGGHALPDSDIDVALTFFERTRTESLPLHPPLSARVPRSRETQKDLARADRDAASPPEIPAATSNAGPADSDVPDVEPDSF